MTLCIHRLKHAPQVSTALNPNVRKAFRCHKKSYVTKVLSALKYWQK